MKTIELGANERIVAVVPEVCAGAGWRNTPVWVYITTPEGNFREECIQPEDQSPEMHTLFNTGAAICRELIKAVTQRKGE